jgi:hypothetical protein
MENSIDLKGLIENIQTVVNSIEGMDNEEDKRQTESTLMEDLAERVISRLSKEQKEKIFNSYFAEFA